MAQAIPRERRPVRDEVAIAERPDGAAPRSALPDSTVR